MIWLLTCLVVSAAGLFAFIGLDATYAFDGDPNTHSLSEKIKHWRRGRAGRTFLVGLACFQLALAPFYLFVHLVLEAW